MEKSQASTPFDEDTGIPVSNVLEKGGSQHAVADALSRAPVTLQSTDDLPVLGEEVYAVQQMNLCLDATDAESDNTYFQEI